MSNLTKLTTLWTLTFLTNLIQIQVAGQSAAAVNKIGDEGRRASTTAALRRAAEKSTLENDHFSSLKYWAMHLEADSSDEALAGYATAAFQLQNFAKADSAFQKVVLKNSKFLTAEQQLTWAETKYRLRDFAEAEALFQSILNKKNNSQATKEAAEAGLENINWAKQTIENSDSELAAVRLSDLVNSSNAEFAPFLKNDTLYFSSFNFEWSNDKNFPKRSQSRVLTLTSDEAGNQQVLATDFNDLERLTAHTAFNRTGNLLFFTVCDYVKTAQIQCAIYMKTKNLDGSWSQAVRLPNEINAPGFTTTEPNVGWNSDGSQEVLFFASDRPLGRGRRDIWYTLILPDGKFSEPVNLTTLNTAGDEMTPFFHAPTSTLYFSSDGYQTLGGLDVYKTRGLGVKWTAPEHLGLPVNSDHDDAHYFLSDDENFAYFSSNRAEAKDDSKEYCCPDIFKIDWRKPEIIAITFDKETGDTLSNLKLVLTEVRENEEFTFQVKGKWAGLPAHVSQKFSLVATKDGYRADTIFFETPSEIWLKPMVKKLYLRPDRVNLIANVFDKKTRQPLAGATCRFVDLGRVLPGGSLATGRDGAPLLNKTDLDPAGHVYKYGLEFNHRYRVIVVKDGYTLDSVEVTTEGMAVSTTISKNLYLWRGLNLVANAFDAGTRQPLVGTSIRFFEIAGSRLETGLNAMSHTYNYGLDFEKRYRVVISKKGYLPDSVEFTTADLGSVAFQTIVKDLFLPQFDLAEYLPLTLYFDNDEPDKRTLRTTTNRTYEATYQAYRPREPLFVSSYLSDAKGSADARSAQLAIEQFFEKKVQLGYEKLLAFSAVLVQHLDAGGTIDIQISGFASPRANSDYNKNLTSRRIWSVKNHFANYQNGLLRKFLANGQLAIREVPTGEETARGKNISDLISDQRNSVFSVEASLERRVEIVKVDFKNGNLIKRRE